MTVTRYDVRRGAYYDRQMHHTALNQHPSVALEHFLQPFAAINMGLESFHESLTSQVAQAVHVDWRPPAGGNEKLADLLARMKK